MAASAATASSSPGLCPNYAVICSFLERYGALLDLPELSFPQLERYLQDTSSVPKLLVELHVKLLRKIGKSVSADRWEKYLVKVCQDFNTTWAWELEQKGYKELTLECKTGILKYLCECQFDENVKFKTAINEEDPDKMRLQPIGRDKDGQMYWFQLDQDNNVRVYVEEQDDLDGSSWKCIVRDRNDLAEVVALLKTQIDPELLKREEQKQQSKPDESKGEDKKSDDTSDEDNKDSNNAASTLSPKTECDEKVTQKDILKSETSLNGIIDGKGEVELHSENTSTKAHNIKEEPVEVLHTKPSIVTSEPTTEDACLSVKSEKIEEVKRNSADEMQQSLKNDQQAKIPLKKRGMKFSEDFEKCSSITVQHPSVTQVKETTQSDTAPEQTKMELNDHVNGEIQPALEEQLQSQLSEPSKDTSIYKEQNTETATSKSAVREIETPSTEKERMKGKQDIDGSTEKGTEVISSHQDDLDKKDMQSYKEFTAETEQNEAYGASLPPKADTTPLLKGINNACMKSSNHEKHVNVIENPADTQKCCSEDKATSSTKSYKTLIDESDNPHLNQEISPKESKTKDSEESSEAKKENVSDIKQIELGETDTKDKDISEQIVEKSNPSVSKEKQEDIKTTETESAVKETAKKTDDSENTISPPATEMTEMLEKGDYTETRQVTQCSTVDENADKQLITDESKENSQTKEAVEVSPIEKVNKSEYTPAEKQCGGKDAEITPKENCEAPESDPDTEKLENTKKTEKPEDTKSVNCNDSEMHDVTKISDSVPVQMKVEAVAVKQDLTKPQEEDKIEMKFDALEMREETPEEKDKPSNAVEKTGVSEETDKESKKVEEMVFEEHHKTETEHASSKSNKDSHKLSKKDDKFDKGSEEHQCQEKESPEDFTTDKLSKNYETREEEHEKSGTSTKIEESGHEIASKEPDAKSPSENEKPDHTSKEPNAKSPSEKEKPHHTSKEPDAKSPSEKEKPDHTSKEPDAKSPSEHEKPHHASKEPDAKSSSESQKPDHIIKESDATCSSESEKPDHTIKEPDAKSSSESEKPDHIIKESDATCSSESEKPDHTIKEPDAKSSSESEKLDHPRKEPDDKSSSESEKIDHTIKEPDTKYSSESEKPDHPKQDPDAKSTSESEKPDHPKQDPDAKSTSESEKPDHPSKEPETDKSTDEESKSKSGEQESAPIKEVTNGETQSDVRVKSGHQKIKPPSHRRKIELLRRERHGDSESDTNTGRSLRRSPRISRPTAKAVEIHDRKAEKPQATPPAEKPQATPPAEKPEKDNEEEEEVVVKAVQKKPREKKPEQEGQLKPKGRKRRKIRWSNTRTRRKKKGSEDEDDNSNEESSEDEESEDEDDSDEDYKIERSRKRRNRNRERRSSDSSTSSDDDLPPNDDPCKHCGLPNHPELILLCDSCDNGYHTACLRPPLMIIPDGEWFCPPCQHKQLHDKLEEQLQNLDAALKKKERAERRKERLIFVGISVENIITPTVEVEEEKPEIIIKEKKEVKRSKSWGRRSTRTKKNISYRFDEFDEAIEEAIEEDIKEAEGGGAGRGKDMANITGHRGKDISTILQAEEGKENGRPARPSACQRRKKRRRLNDLDSDSTVDEEESEEEFRLSESSEEEFVVSENESEAETEADSNNSDFGSNSSGRHHALARSRKPSYQRRSSRKRRRPRGYSDEEEEETDEEDEEDEIVTEGSSEFSDSDLDMSRRRSRRSQKKQVNYCETSESEGSQAETNRAKLKPRRLPQSSDSDASFSRDSEEELRVKRVKKRADSSEEDSRQRRRRLVLKRRRASEDDDSDDDSEESSSEEDRPIRKRVNRIDSDDDDEEEKPKDKKTEEESKGTNTLDCSLVELPPTNGQSPIKSLEGLIARPAATAPGLIPHLEPPKNITATPAAAIAPNGLVGQDVATQDDDEDDLLGVTDLVDYVCNNEQL